jgi:DNA-binding FadR family transcriptional regulator
LLDSIGESLIEVRRKNLAGGSADETLHLHRRILGGIVEHDVETARIAMSIHLDQVEQVWLGLRGAPPAIRAAD